MFQKFVVAAAWLLLGFITYATLSPIAARPTLPIPTGFEHFAAFAALGALFCMAYPRQIALVCTLVFGSAALLEIAQLMTPDRHARLIDALQKLAGGAFGIVVTSTIRRLAYTIRVRPHEINPRASKKEKRERRNGINCSDD